MINEGTGSESYERAMRRCERAILQLAAEGMSGTEDFGFWSQVWEVVRAHRDSAEA